MRRSRRPVGVSANIMFEDAVLHVTHNLEYGLGFLEVDPQVELPEAGEDDPEFVHKIFELGPRLEAPPKM